MNDISAFVEGFGDWSLVGKLAVPVGLGLLAAFFAFLLWAAGKIASQEQLTFARTLPIVAAELLVVLGLGWVLLKAFGGGSVESLGTLETLGPVGGILVPIDFAVVVCLLFFLGRVPWPQGAMAWGSYLLIVAHVALLVVGVSHLGQALYEGVQTPGAFGGEAVADYLWIAACCFFSSVAGLILWMAGALASAEKLYFLKAVAMGWVKTPVLLTIWHLGGMMVADMLPDLDATQRLVALGVLVLLANLALVVAGTVLVANISVGRGVAIWFLEIPLYVLLAALAVGIDLVGVAVYQTAQSENGARVLEIVGVGLIGAVAAALLIFFGGHLLNPSVAAPRRTAA